MRDYTLHKLTFVLMAGLPGTGKTTLAAALGETLGCPIIDKDYLKESLLQAPINAITQEELGRAVYEIVFAFAYDMLVRQQISVILDTAALYPFILERASSIACAAGAQLKIILCRADLNVRNERVRKRKSSIVQPYLNTTAVEDDWQLFEHLPQDILVLCTVHPLKEYIAPTIEYLLA